MRKALAITRKEWRELRGNWQVLGPMLLFPLMFGVFLPAAIVYGASIPGGGLHGIDVEKLRQAIPELRGMTPEQEGVYFAVFYICAPIFTVMPSILPLAIAADSMAGEKERKTIEGLLTAPVTDLEILVGKALVAFIPSIALTWGTAIVFTVIVDLGTHSLFGRFILPNLTWTLLTVALSPLISLFSIGLMVISSTRAKGVKEASQLGGLAVLPPMLLLFGQLLGAAYLGVSLTLIVILLFALADCGLYYIGTQVFGREEILARL